MPEMKKRRICLMLGALLLTGCGNDTYIAAEMNVQTEPVLTEDVRKTAKELGLPDTAVYNPDIGEYYDSSVVKWNGQSYELVRPADQIPRGGDTPEFDGDIPQELQDLFSEHIEQLTAYQSEHPLPIWSSAVMRTDTEALKKLRENYGVQYWNLFCQLAVTRNSYTEEAQNVVAHLLHIRAWYCSGNDFAYGMKTRLTKCTAAVSQFGNGITAAQAAEIQKEYGYLIAAPLADLGRLDSMQISDDSFAKEPGTLAEIARFFSNNQ